MPVCHLVECDGCRAAYIKANETDIADALVYIVSRGWSVDIQQAGTVRTLCPRCAREGNT
jgi:hypothetical protein